MIKEYLGRIKVNDKIKARKKGERVEPELEVGREYFVSFGTNHAYPCKLLEIINEFDRTEVRIEVRVKPKSKKKVQTPLSQTHTLYADEIGLTPEDAVKNEVK